MLDSLHMKLHALFLVVAGVLFTAQAAEEAHYPPLGLGAKAPDFSLRGVDGKTYSLKDFADAKVLAIVFTCNHCPTAQAYEERIKKLVEDFKPRGVAVVA